MSLSFMSLHSAVLLFFFSISCTKSNSELGDEFHQVKPADELFNAQNGGSEEPSFDEQITEINEDISNPSSEEPTDPVVVVDPRDPEAPAVPEEPSGDSETPSDQSDEAPAPDEVADQPSPPSDPDPLHPNEHPKNPPNDPKNDEPKNDEVADQHPSSDSPNDPNEEVADNELPDNEQPAEVDEEDVLDNLPENPEEIADVIEQEIENEDEFDDSEDPIAPVDPRDRLCWADRRSQKIVEVNTKILEISAWSKHESEPKKDKDHRSCGYGKPESFKFGKHYDLLHPELLVKDFEEKAGDSRDIKKIRIKFEKKPKHFRIILLGIYHYFKEHRKKCNGLEKLANKIIAKLGGEEGIIRLIKSSNYIKFEDNRVCPLLINGNHMSIHPNQKYKMYQKFLDSGKDLAEILVKRHKFSYRLNKKAARGYLKGVLLLN